ncbi:MAG: DUF4340 domain-containing protein [Leptolyngbyaceae cyanobacterium]
MKLQSPTLILVLVAIALGGFVAALELFQSNNDGAPVGDRQALFDFTEAEVEQLTVTVSDQQLQFEKDEDQWQMQSPSTAPADEATVIFLVNLMASAESDRVFEVESENLSEFGFSPPLATIEVELENDDTHQLILGAYDFNRSHIYAQTVSAIAPPSSEDSDDQTESSADGSHPDVENDKADPAATVDVFIVSPSIETAINRPLEDWLQREEPDPDPEATDAESSDLEPPENTDGEPINPEDTSPESTE